jgi:glycerol-3-phosphate dehydrogenase
MVEARLSASGEFVVLDRDQWRALQQEHALLSKEGSSRVESPDFFLLVEESGNQIHVQLVRAGSSELLAEALLPGVEAVRAWLNMAERFRPGDPLNFAVGVLDGQNSDARLKAVSLREELRKAGFRILSRDRVEDLLREGEDLAAGFRSAGRSSGWPT